MIFSFIVALVGAWSIGKGSVWLGLLFVLCGAYGVFTPGKPSGKPSITTDWIGNQRAE